MGSEQRRIVRQFRGFGEEEGEGEGVEDAGGGMWQVYSQYFPLTQTIKIHRKITSVALFFD